jgi:hypothetical protein
MSKRKVNTEDLIAGWMRISDKMVRPWKEPAMWLNHDPDRWIAKVKKLKVCKDGSFKITIKKRK